MIILQRTLLVLAIVTGIAAVESIQKGGQPMAVPTL